jgi:hypothetical protein
LVCLISHGNIQLNGNSGHIEWLGQFFEYIVVELRLTLIMNMKQRSVSVVKQIYVQIMLLVTRLFDQLRYEAQKGCITPPIFTKELVLDKFWSERIQGFLRKTRLGFMKELNYKLIPRNNQHNIDSLTSEEFE